ncbi:TetR/AcrR family transcriptional regulator [Streptococcus gallinaceus]|uniref:AcrR family transcriptional regulator n=1 Tax=Streptococcus gallinaceus TaxID=165758 RepID=A0ABV2JM60_9STRE|nr:TetR/AcrR family transcriptional regulator [Streptococcus gallinaceus]MCP1638949.1 AcrR family transcriptional regulator [Streptococcus gallinaceus]MCP1769807.1 AcrR family transcriptional regulator [Streptococcus gallinaceus]
MQKRQTETKTYIRQALGQLLREEPLEQISISQICKKAGINRGTFYLHFSDKADMMEQYKEEWLAAMDIRIQEHRDQPETVILSILEFVEEDQVFISALSQSKNFLFAQAIKDTLYRIICLYPFWEKQAYLRYDLPAEFAREVYIASIESVISHWIATDFQQSPQELAQMISGLALAD